MSLFDEPMPQTITPSTSFNFRAGRWPGPRIYPTSRNPGPGGEGARSAVRQGATPPGPTGSKRRRTDDPAGPRTRRSKKAKARAATNWAIPRRLVPTPGGVGVQKGIYLHLRVSMGLLTQGDVLPRISAQEMAKYDALFASDADLDAQMSSIIAGAIPPRATPRDAARIGDHHLRFIFNAIANAGLTAFAPDVFGNVESMYNLLHEHLAIHTFRAVALAFGYAHCAVNLSLLDDYSLLRSFYRNYIYGRIAKAEFMARHQFKSNSKPLIFLLWSLGRYRPHEEALTIVHRSVHMYFWLQNLRSDAEQRPRSQTVTLETTAGILKNDSLKQSRHLWQNDQLVEVCPPSSELQSAESDNPEARGGPPSERMVWTCCETAVPQEATTPQDRAPDIMIMWWNPQPADFVSPQSGLTLTRGFGQLRQDTCYLFQKLVDKLLDECKAYTASIAPAEVTPLLPQMAQVVRLALERLRSVPSTYDRMVLGVTGLQRAYLELTGLLRYLSIYKPRMENPDVEAGLPDDCIGVSHQIRPSHSSSTSPASHIGSYGHYQLSITK
ncbi:hypothetical protein B0H14DRAFT_2644887 [Mycena olivaceomarginata]|nr:hypothetical protein B0H14DRAFT_2644887 [Mycena olivaceomarginata]